MATERSEVFLLYNEREKRADEVVSELRERGVRLYFYRRDLPLGGNIREIETSRLQSASVFVVLLGSEGWGVSQAELGQQAVALGKPIVPVLIGDPPEQAMEQVGALFRLRRRLDLRYPTPKLYDELASAIAMIETSGPGEAVSVDAAANRFDDIINTLIDGSDVDRSLLLQRLIRYPVANSADLARRLRTAIDKDFAPGQENQFATAVRAPKRLASARSWMLSALIWLEPSSKDSQRVILDHVRVDREPDREVRFWTLAGIIQRKLPYLRSALVLASEDSMKEIGGLAEIVREPGNEITLHAFREALRSEDFEVAWQVLRILRIVAVPALAADVVRQLDRRTQDKPLTYDALFALASPEMAHAAKPHILEYLGLDRLVALIVQEARSATAIARIAFAHVLLIFDERQVSAALQKAALNLEDRPLVQRISYDIDSFRNAEDLSEPPIAGLSSDAINISQDDIGISKDVDTLASVILSRGVTPPLAIGLFGEWGSGKSFFMDSIEAACTRISAQAKTRRSDQFCTDIVQINFNAWHYADANLWASLVSHILDELSRHLSPVLSADEQHATLASELVSARTEIAAAQAERERANRHLEETAKILQGKVLERERREIGLRDLRAGDLSALLEGNEPLKETIKNALESVGAPAALESVGELNKVVEDSYSTAGRATAFIVSLLSGSNVALIFAGIVLVIFAPPWIAAGVEKVLGDNAGSITELFTKIATFVGALTVVLRNAADKVKTGLDALSKAKRTVDQQLAKKRETPSNEEKKLEMELQDAKASERTAADRVSAASARAQDLEGRVALLNQSQSLGYFVAQRSNSDDYRRHLGLISLIRKDFDGLVDRLKTKGKEQGRQIDRIILYIDDVDRCPPKMVVDILQAVHLLLAYELFVVVVSVDPRWLLRSLESRFTTLQSDGDAESWDATPQDYLEKIFQIPFSVRPMGANGFGRLMSRLLVTSTDSTSPSPTAAQSGPPVADSRDELSAPKEAVAADSSITESSASTEQETGATPVSPPPLEIEALAEALTITAAETEFAQTLHSLLPTPRRAKRFANIYRVMKATLLRNHLSRFEGSNGMVGEFQLPMLLLALLIGDSPASRVLFPEFLARARRGESDWWASSKAGGAAPIEHADLRARLAEILSAPLFPSSPDLLLEWLPQVARYSFTTAKMFLSESERLSKRRETRPADVDFARD